MCGERESECKKTIDESLGADSPRPGCEEGPKS